MLNFIPDLPAALAEMTRVTTPDGTIAAYVWDYAGKMDLMRVFWDTAVELDPAIASMDEGTRFPICRPDALVAAFATAGLAAVDTMAIDIPTAFADFDDYWRPFLGGQGPAPAYAVALDDDARDRLHERLRGRLAQWPGGLQAMSARAWAVRARVAG